ncbi:hypothetical protein D7Y15_08050 [Corallococcus sp. AB030]|uniref:hypothetical protein n=1 Tax=Corallococcus sp. AB030 TaxID=2316716 RepID=UPI000EEEF2F6|nr:hypothetical protein [Corallococcus sp. AB030]RKI18641.1 hypothetical protein D7Y15_08050 [Corallococcus sp. AB030]
MSSFPRLAALALVCLAISPAMAAYSPSSPPEGWVGKAGDWAKLLKQAETQGAEAAKLSKGANAKCLTAIFVKAILATEIGVSSDKADHDIKRNIDPKAAGKVRARAQSEMDDSCNGGPPGSAGATVEAMFKYAAPEDSGLDVMDLRNSTARLYNSAKVTATRDTPWVEYLIKAGFLVRAGAARVATAAGALVPIVDPEMFNRRGNPQDGI